MKKGNKKEKIKMKSEYELDVDDENYSTKKALMTLANETAEFNELLELTYHKDENIRLKALQNLCPCRVQAEVDMFWDRVFQMVEDKCPKIRMQALHNMCDGSPPSLEPRIADALEIFNRDPDSEIRRKAHKVLTSYLRTGKWNIL